MRVAAVGAHPDDVEILCGGTIARLAAEGAEVTLISLTDGAAGSVRIPPAELSETRHAEALRAAALSGAKVEWIGEPDEFLVDTPAVRSALIVALRRAQPELVVTHHPADYHPDHRTASSLAFAASLAATLPMVLPTEPAVGVVPALAYFETLGGAGFVPDQYVDISDYFEKKLELFGCHESQAAWLGEHDVVDMTDVITTVARFRGYQCGVRYAEAFAWEGAWGRPRASRLLP